MRLVGGDGGEVALAARSRFAQCVEGRASRGDMQLDLCGDAGARPGTPGHRGVLLADIAADDAPVRRQGKGDRARGVAGEGGDREAASSTEEAGDERRER